MPSPKPGAVPEDKIRWRVEYGHNSPFVKELFPDHHSPEFLFMKDAVDHYKNVDPWMNKKEPNARRYIAVQVSVDGGITYPTTFYIAVQNRLPRLPRDSGLTGIPPERYFYYGGKTYAEVRDSLRRE